jgi:hypothetical protein
VRLIGREHTAIGFPFGPTRIGALDRRVFIARMAMEARAIQSYRCDRPHGGHPAPQERLRDVEWNPDQYVQILHLLRILRSKGGLPLWRRYWCRDWLPGRRSVGSAPRRRRSLIDPLARGLTLIGRERQREIEANFPPSTISRKHMLPVICENVPQDILSRVQ